MAGEQGPVPAVSTPRPGPQPQAHLCAQLSLCVCLLGRAQALGGGSGYRVSTVVFILECRPWMSECLVGFVLNPGTNSSAAKAGSREQEAAHLLLITTPVYPVCLGEIWLVHVGMSG